MTSLVTFSAELVTVERLTDAEQTELVALSDRLEQAALAELANRREVSLGEFMSWD